MSRHPAAGRCESRRLPLLKSGVCIRAMHSSISWWRMVIANHRPEVMDRVATNTSLQLGFADSGAHLRNMAFYNSPVRFLRRVNEAQKIGKPFITLAHAFHSLTGELADFYGIDAGYLRVGDRADVVIINPKGLDASMDAFHEAPVEEFGGFTRMVNRSYKAVTATLIAGETVFANGEFSAGVATTLRTGQFLRVGEKMPASVREVQPAIVASAPDAAVVGQAA